MGERPFRVCRVCGQSWSNWRDFLLDPLVRVVGLQAVPMAPEVSVLVFGHGGCGGLSVRTSVLRELMDEPGSVDNQSEPCEGCFRDLDELARCNKPCVVAADRNLTLKVLKMKRGA